MLIKPLKKDNFQQNFIVFNLFLYLGMNLSITLMPLYFKEKNALTAYGLAYSAMALSGAFAFFYGRLVNIYGWRKTILIGSVCYAIALFSRIFTDIYIAIFFAFLGGFGASLSLLSVRAWMLERTNSQTLTQTTIIRNILMQSCLLLSMLFALCLSLVKPFFTNIYGYMLVLSSFCICAAISIYLKHEKNTQEQIPIHHTSKEFKFSFVICLILGSTLLSGINTGAIKPFIILILIDRGLSESYALTVFMFMTLAQIITSSMLLKNKKNNSRNPLNSLIIFELILCFIYIMMYFTFGLNTLVCIGLFLIRSVILALTACFEELMHYDVIDKQFITRVIGFGQTFFLIGDAIGALISTSFMQHRHTWIFIFTSLLIFINILILGWLKRSLSKKQKATH